MTVRGVSKSYSRGLRQSQRNGLASIFAEVRGGGARSGDLRTGEFWALRDIDFELSAGTALGVLGRNGAGKSTLLRLVSGISQPTAGEIVRRGTVGSLLDVNAGFDTILTGTENIEASFTLLRGTRPTKDEIEQIIVYAGLEAAARHPVRTYSQGMRLRLGFSVMVHVDPDILIIDEALAVGDVGFQLQCIEYLHSYRRAGGALLFTSHSMWLFQHLASRGIHLLNGELVFEGSPEEVADHYLAELQQGSWVDANDGPDLMEREQVIRRSAADGPGPEPVDRQDGDGSEESGDAPPPSGRPVSFQNITVLARGGLTPQTGDPVQLTFDVFSTEDIGVELGFMFWTADLAICVAADVSNGSERTRSESGTYRLPSGRSTIACEVRNLPLLPGRYALRAAVYESRTGDIMGMAGFEDTPTWFEVVPAPGAALADTASDGALTRLRPLRVLAGSTASYDV